MIRHVLFCALMLCIPSMVGAQSSYQFAVLQYRGGGDYYANPTSVPNLVAFCNRNLGMNIHPEVPYVDVGSRELFNYPFVHMTGHGNVVFNAEDIANLRKYLENGGFLHVDDNYGMDKFIRNEIKKLFPEYELTELPRNHPVFKQKYPFDGLPKIHEHDGKPPQAFGITINGRLVLLYTYETDLGDGWEDADVHGNSEATRQKALKMGANIVMYAMLGGI
jgi:hypothetical protein